MAVPMKRVGVYDPFEQLRRMQREMDDMFETFLVQRPGRELTAWAPRAPLSEIEDKGDAFVLKAELPGMDKEEIKVEVGQDSVTISAEHKAEKQEEKKNFFFSERTYAGYKRSFALPAEINPDQVDADYKNGILTLTMKKVLLPLPKKKEIKLK